MRASFRPADTIGTVLILATSLAAWLFRAAIVAPRHYVAVCASHTPPLICAPRQAVLWLQFTHLWGFSSLLLGLLAFAFRNRPLGIAAIALGIAATINYNATEGIIGAALGLWAWLDRALPDRPADPATTRGNHAREQ